MCDNGNDSTVCKLISSSSFVLCFNLTSDPKWYWESIFISIIGLYSKVIPYLVNGQFSTEFKRSVAGTEHSESLDCLVIKIRPIQWIQQTRCLLPLTWKAKQIQFPKSCAFWLCKVLDNVYKPSDYVSNKTLNKNNWFFMIVLYKGPNSRWILTLTGSRNRTVVRSYIYAVIFNQGYGNAVIATNFQKKKKFLFLTKTVWEETGLRAVKL
jgi:hypothetical protein